jgi:uncharacterized protein YprB with RNaseH-like and TPR domain
MGYKVCELFPLRTKSSVIRKADWMNLKFNKLARKVGKVDKVGYLDIEATQLTANFGWMISWCIKEQDTKKIHTATVTRDEIITGVLDKRIVEELVETLKQFTQIVTYYGARYDIPFIRTRAIFWGIPFIPYGEIEHKDLYFLARAKLRLHSNRLEVVCDLMGIKGKTHLEPKMWVLANTGNEEALKYINVHNRYDVIILEEVHKKLGEFASNTSRSFL